MYFIPYEHLHTNFSVRTFAYVLFSNELYPLRTFAYEQLRPNFMHTNYFHTYFGPRIDVNALSLQFDRYGSRAVTLLDTLIEK